MNKDSQKPESNETAKAKPDCDPRTGSELLVKEYLTSDLPAWSDEKLIANTRAASDELEARDDEDGENARFLSGLTAECDRRKLNWNDVPNATDQRPAD